ncbi:MAG: hypothetical protein LUE27_06835 [Clostridia bacterium]|nr:hypothetical protein [Clostridia bacterium]
MDMHVTETEDFNKLKERLADAEVKIKELEEQLTAAKNACADAYSEGHDCGYKEGINVQALNALYGAVWSYCGRDKLKWQDELMDYESGYYLIKWELYTDEIDEEYLPKYGEWLAEKAKELDNGE